MKDLQNYTTALQDVGLDSTPNRNDSGKYSWSNGQLEILNQSEFNQLRETKLKIEQVDDKIKNLSQEILAFEAPALALEKEGNGLLDGDKDEIEEQRNQLEQYKNSLAQLDKDMLLRGYIPPEEEPPVELASPKTPAKNKITVKEVFSFLLIWLIGEVFMTYVQWNSLRDGRGIEDMIVRSISLGVVLFLIHLVGRYYKQEGRYLHLAFLGFSFLMLFTMLLAPLVINELYPTLHENSASAAEWSLTDEAEATPIETISPHPFWVNFYRKNDMLPGIFVFLTFVIMQTFDKKKTKSVPVQTLPLATPGEGKNQIEERRQYFNQKITQAEKRLKELNQIQNHAIAPNTTRLQHILDELQSRQHKVDELQKDKARLSLQIDQLLRKLEMYLYRYQTEYLSLLKSDPVKAIVIKPEWPETKDIKAYFNLS